MAYDEAKDVEIGRLVAVEDEKQRIDVSVHRYEGESYVE